MKKRMLSFALVLVLVLSLLPVAASAEDGTSGALTYEIHDDKATITACDKDVSGALVIPDTLGGCPVTAIGKFAFSTCSALTHLTIPSTVTEIGERAFFHCSMMLTFTGHAPNFDAYAFNETDIFAVYPSGDKTWTEEKRIDGVTWLESGSKPGADTAKDSSETLSSLKSNNAQQQNYSLGWTGQCWSQPVNSYLYAEGDVLTRVEYHMENDYSSSVSVEQYDAAGKLQWKKTIQTELPIWGGFYAGKDYNFLVYGQSNPKESDSVEVFRVVRYTKNWHRVDDARIYGANTYEPFNGGSLRMAQSGDFLYVHTAHQMYHSSDGWNHQKNISFDVYIPTMTVIAASSGGFVSHSFNQFVIADGADVVQLDHGDASPRALKVTRFTGAAGTPRGNYAQSSEVFPIYGKSGENWTGVQVGGFEASDTHYLIAGTSTEQKENGSKVRNLFIGATTKSKLGQSGDTAIRWLTSYKPNSDGSFPVYVSNPQLVKISDHRFLLLWIEAKDSLQSVKGSTLHYVFLNGKGEKDGKVYSVAEIPLSDCRPIVVGNSVVWYVTTSREPIFFRIDLSAPDSLTRTYRGATTIPGDSFSDVRSTDYFAEPVEWAAMAGITSGTTKTTFSPNAPCTRGQMVTFLWRAMGQPEPTTSKNPFRDVKSSDYFYKAVLWAVEKEITAGTSATTFSPAATVTRAQTVTFLWRAAGKPAVNIQTPFTDVPAGQYYEDAALWAYDNRITQGTKINYQNVSPFEPVPYEPAVSFSPGDPCTRAQIVTFLYRYLAK